MKPISDYIKERWLQYLFNACEANFAYYPNYEAKNSYLDDLAQELLHLNLTWGWGIDERQGLHKYIIYIDTAEGQVSLHSEHRFIGPDYDKKWDGLRQTYRRVRLLVAKNATEIFDSEAGWKRRGYRLKLNPSSHEWVEGYYHLESVTKRPLPPPKSPKIGKSRAEWKQLGFIPKRSE